MDKEQQELVELSLDCEDAERCGTTRVSNKVGAIGRVWKLASPMSLYPQGLQASPQVPFAPFETDSGLGRQAV